MRGLLPNPYLLALGIVILTYILMWGLKSLLTLKVSRLTGNPKNRWDTIVVFTVEKTSDIFMLGLAIYFGFRFIPHKKLYNAYAEKFFFVLIMYQLAIWCHYLLDMWIVAVIRRKTKLNPAVANSVSLIRLLGRFLLFSVIFLFTLSNLGIKITTIVAGLGVGGIAVALALQKILGDLFSSLSIALDKPFLVGDFIVIDDYMGEVEKIGLKTTRLRSLSGEQLIFSNSDLLAARIRNYKRMHERRVIFNLHLPLNLKLDQLKSAISLIAAIIRTKNRVRFDRCHLLQIAQASLEIETVFWVLSEDYNIYMDIQQDILFDIKQAFEAESLHFALPTQTIEVMPTEITMRAPINPYDNKSKPVDSIVS